MNHTRKRDPKYTSTRTKRISRTLKKRKDKKEQEMLKRREKRFFIQTIQSIYNKIKNTIQKDKSIEKTQQRLQYGEEPFHYTIKNSEELFEHMKNYNNIVNFEQLNIEHYTPLFLLTHGAYPTYNDIAQVPLNNKKINHIKSIEDAFFIVPENIVIVDYTQKYCSLRVENSLFEKFQTLFLKFIFNDILQNKINKKRSGIQYLERKVNLFLSLPVIREELNTRKRKLKTHKQEQIFYKKITELPHLFKQFILKDVLHNLKLYVEGNPYFNILLQLETIIDYDIDLNDTEDEIVNDLSNVYHAIQPEFKSKLKHFCEKYKDKYLNDLTHDDINPNYKIKYINQTNDLELYPPTLDLLKNNSNVCFTHDNISKKHRQIECCFNQFMFLSEFLYDLIHNQNSKIKPYCDGKYYIFVHSCRDNPNYEEWDESYQKDILYQQLFESVYKLGKFNASKMIGYYRSLHLLREDEDAETSRTGLLNIHDNMNDIYKSIQYEASKTFTFRK